MFPSLDNDRGHGDGQPRTAPPRDNLVEPLWFLDKLLCIVRTSGLLGLRVRQTSSAYMLCFPKGLGGLAVAAFKISPERNNCPPSELNSEMKKGFQGSGFDLGSRGGGAAQINWPR